jgi:sugar phosphate isomerase/epimerase
MIRSPIALRLADDPARSARDRWREAAALGARGLVLDAAGPLAPRALSETARRDVRQTLRALDLSLAALHLPTRRPFDTLDQLDDRLARADQAFELAYALGTRLVLVRAGAVPTDESDERRVILSQALTELGRRADRRGIRLAVEADGEPAQTLAGLLDSLGVPSLAASVDPAAFLARGADPAGAVVTLGDHLAHAYATDGASPSFAARPGVRHAGGFGFSPAALDWESYLGALEEIDYRGYLTVWPDPRGDVSVEARRVIERLKRF